MLKGIKVGDEVYFVSAYNKYPVTVTKVGRKWFYTDKNHNSRFSLASGGLDSEYTTFSMIWRSKKEYDDAVSLNNTWKLIRNWFYNKHKKPEMLDDYKLREIAKIIGLEIKGK